MAEFGGVKPLVSPSYKGSPAPEFWPPYCRGRQRAQCPSHRETRRAETQGNGSLVTYKRLPPSPFPLPSFPSPCLTGPLLTLYTIYNLSAPKPFSLRRTCVFGSAFILEPVPVQVDVHDRATAHKLIGGRWIRKCPDSFRPRQRLGHMVPRYPRPCDLSHQFVGHLTATHRPPRRRTACPHPNHHLAAGDTQFNHRWITLSYVWPH